MISLVRFFKLCRHGFCRLFAEQADDDDGDGAEDESRDDLINTQGIQTCFPENDSNSADEDTSQCAIACHAFPDQ